MVSFHHRHAVQLLMLYILFTTLVSAAGEGGLRRRPREVLAVESNKEAAKQLLSSLWEVDGIDEQPKNLHQHQHRRRNRVLKKGSKSSKKERKISPKQKTESTKESKSSKKTESSKEKSKLSKKTKKSSMKSKSSKAKKMRVEDVRNEEDANDDFAKSGYMKMIEYMLEDMLPNIDYMSMSMSMDYDSGN